MSDWVQVFLDVTLIILVLLMLPCAWRVVMGPSSADRLQAIDTITNLLIGVIVVLTLEQNTPTLIDMGIALAAFAFVGSLSIARYIGEGRVF